jgi:hypothetical protein
VWLGAVTSAEAELARATARVRETFGLGDDRASGDLFDRIRRHREEFERKVDEGVHSAIARVRAPIDKESAALRARGRRCRDASRR